MFVTALDRRPAVALGHSTLPLSGALVPWCQGETRPRTPSFAFSPIIAAARRSWCFVRFGAAVAAACRRDRRTRRLGMIWANASMRAHAHMRRGSKPYPDGNLTGYNGPAGRSSSIPVLLQLTSAGPGRWRFASGPVS